MKYWDRDRAYFVFNLTLYLTIGCVFGHLTRWDSIVMLILVNIATNIYFCSRKPR
jgi:hypothetical protein